mmetsp:Transcript_13299/g.29232  ORF Transcript_13299/g.29232 Transcript_13299/m.29232 type:complete len:208 (+) Transcript_13299:944-1567(+)
MPTNQAQSTRHTTPLMPHQLAMHMVQVQFTLLMPPPPAVENIPQLLHPRLPTLQPTKVHPTLPAHHTLRSTKARQNLPAHHTLQSIHTKLIRQQNQQQNQQRLILLSLLNQQTPPSLLSHLHLLSQQMFQQLQSHQMLLSRHTFQQLPSRPMHQPIFQQTHTDRRHPSLPLPLQHTLLSTQLHHGLTPLIGGNFNKWRTWEDSDDEP